MAESASPQICPVFVVCRSYQDGNSDKLLLLKIDLVSPSRRDSLVPALQVRGGESHGEIHLDAFEIWFSKEKVGVGIEGRWLRSIQCLSDKREDPDSFSRTSVKCGVVVCTCDSRAREETGESLGFAGQSTS